jgi:hypothetical protein
MPHSTRIKWPSWVDELADLDPCLGRVVREAVVAQDAALSAGAKKVCPKAYAAAEQTLNALRYGKVRPHTDAAWKKAADALRKFTEVLDCTASPVPAFGSTPNRRRRAKRCKRN